MTRTRIFFATDIHGSECCFRKFINAGKFYKADVLIHGGDLTGKKIIPIVKDSDGSYTSYFLGREYTLRTTAEVEALEQKIRDVGSYPYIASKDEIEELHSNPTKLDEIFSLVLCESLRRWIHFAEERLKDTKIKCFISSGNDDSHIIDRILEESNYVVYPEGKSLWIDEHHEMVSSGFANMTPWKCPRDVPDEELSKIIEKMVSQVTRMENCIFNLHCPPFNTNIDLAPKLDDSLKPILGPGGTPLTVHVGSKAIRNIIEKYQPLLGLHGHIHESKGLDRIGRTICVNPGSEYAEGILKGFLVDLTDKGIKAYLFTTG
uniref:Metallophosphoesterase n=1 Tax=Fervidicoccus fontis TaxID=683846 RepID=A0A7J3SNJ0_9CREN